MRALLFTSLVVLSSFLTIGCGGGQDSGSAIPTTPSADGVRVSIVTGSLSLTNTAYSPNPITVQRGGTVTWTNNDNTSHTSTSDSGAWNSGTIAPGATFTMSFPTAGSFPYHCTIHPNMVGTVSVQ